jgi:hypothetical protein
MATAAPGNPPSWFRIVALLAILWNAYGVAMYLHSVGVWGNMTDVQLAATNSIPAAIKGAFALGTFGGLIGSLGLLLRKRWALPVLLVSLLALVVLEGWIVFLSGMLDQFGLAIPIIVTLGAVLLAWLAYHARQRGWLA